MTKDVLADLHCSLRGSELRTGKCPCVTAIGYWVGIYVEIDYALSLSTNNEETCATEIETNTVNYDVFRLVFKCWSRFV